MNEQDHQYRISRRELLARTAKAGVSVAALGGLAAWLYKRPALQFGTVDGSVTMPDFSLPELRGQMAIITGADRTQTVRRGLAALGGIGKFIAKGDRVVLKVNAAFSSAPMLSATAHPDVVSEVVRQCLTAGAESVVVTDNSINDPVSCFALSGIGPAARSAGAKMVLPKASAFRLMSLPGGKLICDWPVLYGPLEGADKLIGITPVKDHARSGASMSMKNFYGLLGGRRNIFHQNINTIIKELAMLVRPTLVVLDGTTSMMHNGPTGGSLDDLKQTNTMILSTDPIAADAFGATLLEKSSTELPYIAMAAEAGVGAADYESLNPRRADVGGEMESSL